MSSDKTATERLRRLLDARGVEWSAQDRFTRDVETRWLFPASSALFTEYEDGMTIMVISGAEWTPEQAIAATLGNDGVERTNDGIAERGTCHDVWDTELTGRLRFQCSECGGVSLEITPHFCPCCGRKVGGRMSDETDTSGTDCGHVRNVSATERLRELLDERGVEWIEWKDPDTTAWFDGAHVVRADEYDGQLLVERVMTPEQAIAATLENDGVVTEYKRSKNGVDERETCHNVAEPDEMNDRPFRCSECGARAPFDGTYHMGESYELDGMRVFADSWPTWRFCPCCGRKVVFE